MIDFQILFLPSGCLARYARGVYSPVQVHRGPARALLPRGPDITGLHHIQYPRVLLGYRDYSLISLDVMISNILEYFSDIAITH